MEEEHWKCNKDTSNLYGYGEVYSLLTPSTFSVFLNISPAFHISCPDHPIKIHEQLKVNLVKGKGGKTSIFIEVSKIFS